MSATTTSESEARRRQLGAELEAIGTPLRARLEREPIAQLRKLGRDQGAPTSRGLLRARLDRFTYVAGQLKEGLAGKPFSWGSGSAAVWVPICEAMGVTLVSRTRIKRLGRQLKRGAKPVGSLYFGAPISREAHVWVLECQTVEAQPRKRTREESHA